MTVLKKSKGRTKAPLTPWKKKEKKQLPGVASLDGRWGYPAIAPFFLIFIVFGVAPVLYSIYIAFFKWDPLGESEFNGINNFTFLLQDSDFWIALRNTFSIWALSTFPQLVVAISWRTILLVPNITSIIAITIVFQQLFGREYGLINGLLTLIPGIENIDFIEGIIPSHIQIATMISWRWVGYNTLIFLASMLAIPDELYESASVDGASKWQQFKYVTLPSLKNTITFVLIVGTIGGLQVFAEPQQLNAEGGSTKQFLTLTLFLYNQAFLNNKYGYAAAIGIAITIIVLIISAINFVITRRLAGEGSR
jgi:cellobiose transport system permease protein